MSIDLVTRKEWGARKARDVSYIPGTKGVKVHYTGSLVDPEIEHYHSKCVALARQIQNGHMDGNGWNDIGYSMLICPHRKVFEGRGPLVLPSANGSGLNSYHYAVLGMVGSEGYTKPNDLMLHGIRDAIEYLRKVGNAGNEIKGHRDGYSTSCPGELLYAWVKRGAPRPNTVGTIEKEDDMPGYVSLALSDKARISVPENKWTTLAFDVEHSDSEKQHAEGLFPSFLNGKSSFTLEVAVRIENVHPTVEGQIRLYEVDSETEEVKKYHSIEEWHGTTGDTFIKHSSVGTVDAGNKLRVMIIQYGTVPVVVRDCTVKALYWK